MFARKTSTKPAFALTVRGRRLRGIIRAARTASQDPARAIVVIEARAGADEALLRPGPAGSNAAEPQVRIRLTGRPRSDRLWLIPAEELARALEDHPTAVRIQVLEDEERILVGPAGAYWLEDSPVLPRRGLRGRIARWSGRRRRLLGIESVARNTAAMGGVLRDGFTAILRRRAPPPEEARFEDHDDVYLDGIRARYALQFWLSAAGAAGILAYAAGLALSDAWLKALVAFAAGMPALAYAQRAAFRNWQIRNRTLGGYEWWLRHPREWLPR